MLTQPVQIRWIARNVIATDKEDFAHAFSMIFVPPCTAQFAAITAYAV